MKSNIMNNEQTTDKISEVLYTIKGVLEQTFGPNGFNILVQDPQLNHFATKDGYTVLNKIQFFNSLERTIHMFIQKVSARTNRITGDGTTSSILVACELIPLLRELTIDFSPKEIYDITKKIEKYLSFHIKQKALETTIDKLEHIATVSANNDEKIGKILADVFSKIGKYGIVQTKQTNDFDEIVVEYKRGFEHKRGMVIPCLGNERKSVYNPLYTANDCRVLLFDGTLSASYIEGIVPLMSNVAKDGFQFVIIARKFDDQFLNFIHANKEKNGDKFDICAVEFPENADGFNILEFLIDAKILRQNEVKLNTFWQTAFESLGKAKEIKIDNNSTFVIPYDFSKEKEEMAKEKINLLLDKIEDFKKEEETKSIIRDIEIIKLKNLISSLTQEGSAVIHIGAPTSQEKQTLSFLIEDAICASKSALENGYVAGCLLISLQSLIELSHLFIRFTRKELYDNEPEVKYIVSEFGSLQNLFGNNVYCNNAFESTLNKIIMAYSKVINSLLDSDSSGEEIEEEYWYNSGDSGNSLVEISIKNGNLFNMKTFKWESFDETTVINSVDTDIEILRGVLSIASLLFTSSSFLSSHTCIDDEYSYENQSKK
jgi:chaperonin GroEL